MSLIGRSFDLSELLGIHFSSIFGSRQIILEKINVLTKVLFDKSDNDEGKLIQ